MSLLTTKPKSNCRQFCDYLDVHGVLDSGINAGDPFCHWCAHLYFRSDAVCDVVAIEHDDLVRAIKELDAFDELRQPVFAIDEKSSLGTGEGLLGGDG